MAVALGPNLGKGVRLPDLQFGLFLNSHVAHNNNVEEGLGGPFGRKWSILLFRVCLNCYDDRQRRE